MNNFDMKVMNHIDNLNQIEALQYGSKSIWKKEFHFFYDVVVIITRYDSDTD